MRSRGRGRLTVRFYVRNTSALIRASVMTQRLSKRRHSASIADCEPGLACPARPLKL